MPSDNDKKVHEYSVSNRFRGLEERLDELEASIERFNWLIPQMLKLWYGMFKWSKYTKRTWNLHIDRFDTFESRLESLEASIEALTPMNNFELQTVRERCDTLQFQIAENKSRIDEISNEFSECDIECSKSLHADKEQIKTIKSVLKRIEEFQRYLVYDYLNKGKDEYGEDINALLGMIDYIFEQLKEKTVCEAELAKETASGNRLSPLDRLDASIKTQQVASGSNPQPTIKEQSCETCYYSHRFMKVGEEKLKCIECDDFLSNYKPAEAEESEDYKKGLAEGKKYSFEQENKKMMDKITKIIERPLLDDFIQSYKTAINLINSFDGDITVEGVINILNIQITEIKQRREEQEK